MKKLPLNLLYLKYFSDAVRLGSVSASAKENFVSQSAVSQAISKLERVLEVALIDHHPNRLKVSPEGQHVFEKGLAIFSSIESLEDSLEAGDYVGKVEFACTHSFALALLPEKMKQAKKKFPQMRCSFRFGHPGIIIDLLKRGIIDFGVVLDNEDLSAFDTRELHQGEYKLYVAKKLAKERNLRYLLTEERREVNLLKSHYRKKYQKEMQVDLEVSSWEVLARLTELGLGKGFFPDYIAKNKSKITECNLGLPKIPYKIYAITPKGRPLTRNTEAFFSLWN